MGQKNTGASERETAFLKALDDHQGIIMRICRVYCNNHSDEDDLFQEIVYQLWKAYPSFENQSSISTWIYSVALKTAMVPYKRRARVEYMEDVPDLPDSADPYERGSPDEFYKRFHRLSPMDRALLTLLMEGYTRKEIAAIVGIGEDGVHMRAARLAGRW